jgi:quercetin dioxygenase-like cupin family protein
VTGTEDGPRGASALIEYQDGAVVSKTLLKKEAGTVTVFAFDAAQELSEHTVPHDALIYLLEGEAEIRVAGRPHHLVRGDLLLLPAGEPHAVRASERFKMLLTMIRS